MSLNYIKAQIKTREDIEATLTGIDVMGDKTLATYGKKNIEISNNLWELCGKTVKVLSCARQSHEYDFSHLMTKEDEDGCVYCPYVYLMEDWLEPVEDEEYVEDCQ